MKKIVLSTLLVLLVNTMFSQVKYITFTDSLLFDINGPGYMGNIKIKSIPNSNDYIVAGRYDDMTYGMDYYMVKLDYRGDVVFDTVMGFNSLSSMPYAEVQDMDVSENDYTIFSNFENANYNRQPFIANFDIYGEYNWNKYYDIDSLNFDVVGGFKTNEGGYVSYGKVNNLGNGGYAYLYKVDNLGNIIWSKFYGVKDSTNPEFDGDIQSVIQTNDNGYIASFFKSTNDFGSNEGLISFIKIDDEGSIQWRKSLRFDAPHDNSLDWMSRVTSLNVLDNDNVLISATLMDTALYTRRLGLISINPSNGGVNWKKSYYLNPGEGDFSVEELIKSNEPNRLLGYFNNEINTGILFKMDYSGNILAMETHQELPLGNFSNYYNGITATNDYGCLVYGYKFSGDGQILFKTDKDLKNNCSESASFSFFNIDTLGLTTYMMADTVFDVVVNEMTTTTTSSPSVESLNDTYCSCDLSLYGNVTYSSISADSVQVLLYKIEGNGAYHLEDSVLTDASGYYQFSHLPEGDYIVKAKPKLAIHTGYLPTYFAMTSGATQWDNAFVYPVFCIGFNPISIDIDLIAKTPQTGSWQCSGYVYKYFGYPEDVMKKAPGDPIPDIDITIDQSPGGAVSSTTTDEFGYYEFSGLDNNATFIVRADIPGLPNDSIYTFTVSPSDGTLDSLNFYVDSVGVYILPEDLFTSVKKNIFSNIKYDLIPNPTRDVVSLVVESTEILDVEVVITNIVGELAFKGSYTTSSGITKYPIDLTRLTQGIYFVRINQGNDYIIKKIIQQ